MRELEQIVRGGAIGEVLHLEGHYCNEHSTRVSGGWRTILRNHRDLG